ncbi:hypothetical protein [uncultured Rhodospira sp.]|uniref:hypothetical protein n=1 Tax=uncultured Rhodospira sp. TaxID=1936189 RepID=UPI002616488E|nr:hypothetical protein [uncultured Rhodospira sp.]
MSGKNDGAYTEDLGEMDGIGPAPTTDDLPSPEELAAHASGVRITASVSPPTHAALKAEAARLGVPIGAVLAALADAWAGGRHHD